jgi:hypothetical protein
MHFQERHRHISDTTETVSAYLNSTGESAIAPGRKC